MRKLERFRTFTLSSDQKFLVGLIDVETQDNYQPLMQLEGALACGAEISKALGVLAEAPIPCLSAKHSPVEHAMLGDIIQDKSTVTYLKGHFLEVSILPLVPWF